MAKANFMLTFLFIIYLAAVTNQNIIHLGPYQDLNEVIKKNPKAIIEFYANWCGPCQRLMPILEDRVRRLGDITLIKVNVDERYDLSSQWGVSGIPHVAIIKNGQMIGKVVGADVAGIDRILIQL